MPGLFENMGIGGGLLGMLTGQGPGPGGLAGAFSPGLRQEALQQQYIQQAYQAYLHGGADQQTAAFLATNPDAAKQYGGQFIDPRQKAFNEQMSAQFPGRDAILQNNPKLLENAAKPEKLEPGDTLTTGGVNLFGGGAPSIPQAQANISALGGQPQAPQPAPQPAPMQPQAAQPNQIAANSAGLPDPETIERGARQGILGDTGPIQGGSGVGAGGKLGQITKQAVNNRLTALMKEQGVTPEELSRRQASFPAFKKAIEGITTTQARMGQAAIEFEQMWPTFERALKATNPGQYPSWNAFQQFVSLHKGDPNVAPLAGLVNSMRNIYGNAISRKGEGATVDDKKHFDQTLNQAWNTGQIESVKAAFHAEMQAAHDSMPKEANVLKVQFGMGDKRTPDIEQQYQDHLKLGKPKDALIRRLQESGYDIKGLQ